MTESSNATTNKRQRRTYKNTRVVVNPMLVCRPLPESKAILRALLNLRCKSIELLQHKLKNYTPHDELTRDVVCATFIDDHNAEVVRLSVDHQGSEDGWWSAIPVQLDFYGYNGRERGGGVITVDDEGRFSYAACSKGTVAHALFLSELFPIEKYGALIVKTLFMHVNASLADEKHELADDVQSFLGMFKHA